MRSVATAFPADSSLPLWRADQFAVSAQAGASGAARPTGYAALDAELPGGGWPAAGATELLLPAPGCGELRLLAPALVASSLLWVAPPFLPYAPALAALGLAIDRLTLASPATPADAAWAVEQALRSGALGTVLWWQGEAPVLPATLRRLHLVAMEGRTPLFALRPAAMRAQSSPAPLRLALSPAGPARLAVDVFKRRGPPMATPLMLALSAPALRRARFIGAPGRLAAVPRGGQYAAAAASWSPAASCSPQELALTSREAPDAVVRPAPERVAA